MANIAVIGAGLAGLVIAKSLASGHRVTVYEKSRGVGGRMATRYADDLQFDHGAQFFTARSAAFRNYLAPAIDAGVIAPWHARFVELTRNNITASRRWSDDYPHYVGAPAMNAYPKWLARGLDIRLQCRVTELARDAGEWRLTLDDGSVATHDWLIVTAPAPQAETLLTDVPLASAIRDTEPMKACYALMLGLTEPPAFEFDAARVLQADISWISANCRKPGRSASPTVVVHATNAWADNHVDVDLDEARQHLRSEFLAVSGIPESSISHCDIHRWRYANTVKQSGPRFLADTAIKLGVAGDWLIRGRVEGAFLSAKALLEALAEDGLGTRA